MNEFNNPPKMQIERYRWVVKHLRKLIELNAPGVIKAQALVTLFIPRLIGIMECQKEFAEIMARVLCESLCLKTLTCMQCRKAEMVGSENLCVKCLAEMDRTLAEYDFGDDSDPINDPIQE